MFYLLMVHHQATVVDLLVVIFFGWSYMSNKSTLELCLKSKNFKDVGVKPFDPIALH